MPDRRALLTEREREIVAGEADDVSDDYRYQTISRVRKRFNRLDDDLAALEAHGALAEELREKVCGGLGSGTSETPPATERRESAHNRSVSPRVQSDVANETTSAANSGDTENADADAGGAIGGLDFPASKDESEYINAIHAARAFLEREGRATKAEIVREVMPEYPVGYDAAAAIEKLDAGDRYRGAWWRRVVKPGLEQINAVEKPARGASEWRYVGESSR